MATEQGGVPWWSNIVVAAVSIAGTHLFTLRRERTKSEREWRNGWVGDARSLVAKISDAAIQHYVDEQSLADTSRSAGIILNDLKRLGQVLRDATCVDPSDTKRTMSAFREYHDCISGSEDFQDSKRAVRKVDDAVCERIRELELELVGLVRRPRRPKHQ
jgi:hypothetical protein